MGSILKNSGTCDGSIKRTKIRGVVIEITSDTLDYLDEVVEEILLHWMEVKVLVEITEVVLILF